MGSLFRSEDMTLCQLYLQADAAYACVAELGELGLVQFKDLNEEVNNFQRKFVQEIRRSEDMDRQLRFFQREMKKDGLPVLDTGLNPEAPAPRDMVDLEATFESIESELKELNNNLEALRRNYTELKELQQVLWHTENFFDSSCLGLAADTGPLHSQAVDLEMNSFGQPPPGEPPLAAGESSRFYLGYVAGVLPRERLPGFQRLLWFACRGNIFLRHSDIEVQMVDITTGDAVSKVVFMAFFQGEQLKTRVKKICEGFKATLYPCPESPDERREMSLGVLTRIQDIEMVLNKSLEQHHRVLNTVSQNWHAWHAKVLKIKAIYHTMNMFHTEGTNYIAECWLPFSQIGTVQMLLNHASDTTGTTAPSLLHPMQTDQPLPTYHLTNKFTDAFQKIIDSYGIASYKEVNPAPFTMITFPFLFSVMFGDMGHGLIMFLFGLILIIKERQLQEAAKGAEMFGIIFGGRYIIMLMGAFSIYSGVLYNDCFSKSINIFGSAWTSPYTNSTIHANRILQLSPSDPQAFQPQTPYPFGVDPIWQMTVNKITFTNGFKKKISIIFGVSQMLLGVILSTFNHAYFKQPLNIICEFIPEMFFLLGMFGYLCALVVTKWVMFSAADSNCAPNILIGYINMFLMSYPTEPCSNKTWYPGQQEVQICLVLLAVVSAVWMLLAKPLFLLMKHRRTHRRPMVLHVQVDVDPSRESATDDDLAQILPEGGQGELRAETPDSSEFEFGEVFIHQAIHTIEFCLGCVSHTASYLRLWALSLAHAQLSEVLWNMVMRMGFNMLPGYFGLVLVTILFVPFAFLTIAILLLMEGLSAFLHTLRLHWVEFQSKFYKGEGHAFVPFCFANIMDEADD